MSSLYNLEGETTKSIQNNSNIIKPIPNSYTSGIKMINIYNNLSLHLKYDFIIKTTKILEIPFHEIISIMEKPIIVVTEHINIIANQLVLFNIQQAQQYSYQAQISYQSEMQHSKHLTITAQEFIPNKLKNTPEEEYQIIKKIWEKHDRIEKEKIHPISKNIFQRRDNLDWGKFRKN